MVKKIMQHRQISTEKDWHAILAQLPHPHTLQSWDWGEFKSRWGWKPLRLAWFGADGAPLAAAQILRRPIPRTPWHMLYAPKAPAWQGDDRSTVTQVLAGLETIARQQRALFIKIDPDVPLAHGVGEMAEADTAGIAIRQLMTARGWRYSPQQVQFKNTVLLDVQADDETLLARMKSKTRYNIRLAGRKGVSVRTGTAADLDAFFRLYAITAERDGFLIRPRAYYLDVWTRYLQKNAAALLLADLNGELIAGVMLFFFGETAWYMYGASDNNFRNVMPNHLLQWRAMQTARERGCATYDLWGAPDVFDESDGMWGVYRFKMGFGGRTRQGLGAYDFPVRPQLYRAYINLLPKLLRLMRRRR